MILFWTYPYLWCITYYGVFMVWGGGGESNIRRLPVNFLTIGPPCIFFLDLPRVHTYIYLLHEQLILKAHIDKLLHLSMHWLNVCRFYRLSTNFVNVCRWSFFHICRWFLTFVSKIFQVSTFVDVLTFVVSSDDRTSLNVIFDVCDV